MIIELDAWVLKKHQDYAEYRQVVYGQHCYQLAYACCVWKFRLGIGFALTSGVLFYLLEVYQLIIFSVSFLLLEILLYFLTHKSIKQKYSTDTKIPEVPHWVRTVVLFWGILWGTTFLFLTGLAIYLLGFAGPLVASPLLFYSAGIYLSVPEVYFASCTPLPPSLLRMRQGKIIKGKGRVYEPSWQGV